MSAIWSNKAGKLAGSVRKKAMRPAIARASVATTTTARRTTARRLPASRRPRMNGSLRLRMWTSS